MLVGVVSEASWWCEVRRELFLHGLCATLIRLLPKFWFGGVCGLIPISCYDKTRG